MTSLLVLPLLVCQIAAQEEAAKVPPVRFGPCGLYDVAELEDHFQVIVTQTPVTASDQVVFRITLIDKPAENDQRRPFPAKHLVIEVRDADSHPVASTPLVWAEPPYRISRSEGLVATVTVNSPLADRVTLRTDPLELHLPPDEPHIVVHFRSLKPK
jgi:hypothetical protein